MKYTIYGDIVSVNKDMGVESNYLPPGFYTVSRDPLGNYFLSRGNLTGVPDVLYGETETVSYTHLTLPTTSRV